MNSTKKILIIGASGFVGKHLFKYLKPKYTTMGTYYKNIKDNLFYLNLLDADSIENTLSKTKPDFIIITAGSKNLKWCEENKDIALKINSDSVSKIYNSEYCKEIKPLIVFISSDYVFSGERGNYTDTDTANPKTIYGKTKLSAEENLKNYSNYLIIRTSALMGEGGSFFEWIKSELSNNSNIEAFDDLFFTPTHINNFVSIIEQLLLSKNRNILLHLCDGYKYNRYEFITKLKEEYFTNSSSKIIPIKSSNYDLIFQKDLSLINSTIIKKLINSSQNIRT